MTLRPREWCVTRRGPGPITRTVVIPLWAGIFVPCVILQSLVLVGVCTAIAILTDDCFSTLILGLASLTTLFMAYFAVEAVRKEDVYQLAAYAASSLIFLVGLPPMLGVEGGHRHDRQLEQGVRTLLLVAVGCACSLQLYATDPRQAFPLDHTPHSTSGCRPEDSPPTSDLLPPTSYLLPPTSYL